MEWLKGKKTILGSIAGGAIITVWSLGWIDDRVAGALLGAVAMWTGIALRLAIREP